jgi:hypothetical protein
VQAFEWQAWRNKIHAISGTGQLTRKNHVHSLHRSQISKNL